MLKQTLSALLWASLALAGAVTPRDRCTPVSFVLPVTAQNAVYPTSPDPNNETSVVEYAKVIFSGSYAPPTGIQSVSGTYTINGVYCKPLITLHDTLQVLVHGITYNKTYWSGLGFGPMYDYQIFANLNGYATLAIDRLGHGNNPQRPDSFNVVQCPLQIEILHQLIGKVKSTATPLDKRYGKVAYIGHSYGSFLGAGLAGQHPDDVAALVLTGYSTTLNFTTASSLQFGSTSSLFPARSNEPVGYLTISQEASRRAVFYAGGYDAAIPPVDFRFEDTVTDGEIAGLPTLFTPVVGYANPLLLVTGVQDALLCAVPYASCNSLLAASGQLFPNVTQFEYTAIPNTGHDLNLHYSAPATFARIHLFLGKYL